MNSKEMVYVLTQIIIEDYNKRFYNLGVYKNLDLANKRLDEEIRHNIKINNVSLGSRDLLSANLSNNWVNVIYKIDVQFLE